MQKGTLNKDLKKKDYPWLSKSLKKGKVVYKYSKYTYGCISKNGVAVSDEHDKEPFYEVPNDSVDWEK